MASKIKKEEKVLDSHMARSENLKSEHQNAINNHKPETRNVTDFQHFLAVPYICASDIEWTLKLRNGDAYYSREKVQAIPNQAFRVASEATLCSKNKKNISDLNFGGNISPLSHLLQRSSGPKEVAHNVPFEANLRISSDKKYAPQESQWWNFAKKDKKEYPKFLPSIKDELELRKLKGNNNLENIKYSAFEGQYLTLPKHNERMAIQNSALFKHLNPSGSFLSTIKWQNSLRDVGVIKLKKRIPEIAQK